MQFVEEGGFVQGVQARHFGVSGGRLGHGRQVTVFALEHHHGGLGHLQRLPNVQLAFHVVMLHLCGGSQEWKEEKARKEETRKKGG